MKGLMKRTTIKGRITLWYVLFFVLLATITFVAALYLTNRAVQDNVKEDLRSTVEESAAKVSIKDGTLDISDRLRNYNNGVYILVYEDGNFLISGIRPDAYPSNVEFEANKVRKVSKKGKGFYVYDKLIESEGYVGIWVRGMTPADLVDTDPAVDFMRKLLMVILPLIIILAALGGYFITKRSLKPLSDLIDTACDIEQGKDLSKRIKPSGSINEKDEIYRLNRTFNDMLDRLEGSFEAEKRFSDDASHELRTPISVILAQCEYALDHTDTLEEARTSIELILKQARKTSGLISQLLTLARADKGTEQLLFEDIDLSETLEIVIDEMKTTAQEKNISITLEASPEIIVSADQTMIMRLLVNLISNSIKYGKENGHTAINLCRNSSCAVCAIKDDGIGIHPDQLPKIWDRFYQADPSRSGDGSGSSGLGLAMVKWIVESHNGTIQATSTLGKGSCFTFTLPIKK